VNTNVFILGDYNSIPFFKYFFNFKAYNSIKFTGGYRRGCGTYSCSFCYRGYFTWASSNW